MHPKSIASVLVVTLALGASSCVPDADEPGQVIITGTVRQVLLDGGCWCIQSADGKLFEITNLPNEYKSDGLFVRAHIRIREDMARACMVGKIAEVIEIERGS